MVYAFIQKGITDNAHMHAMQQKMSAEQNAEKAMEAASEALLQRAEVDKLRNELDN